MKKFLVFLILFTICINIFSQNEGKNENTNVNTVYDIQKNSLHFGTIALFFIDGFYERTIPTGNKSAIITGGGIIQGVAFGNETDVFGKAGCILGGSKHFFECGTLVILIRSSDGELQRILPLIGYRYQSKGGFIFRADVTVNIFKDTHDVSGEEFLSVQPVPGITIGYSF